MAQASAAELEHTRPAEKERVVSVPQSEQLARTPEPPSPKNKKHSHLSRSPDSEMGESQGEREKGGIGARGNGPKGGLHSEGRLVPRR